MGKQGKEAKASKPTVDPTWRWRNVILCVMAYMEANRHMLLRLALDQTVQQSTSSLQASRKHLDWTEQQQGCPHPKEHHQKGGNQHGKWVKCKLCGARLQYQGSYVGPGARCLLSLGTPASSSAASAPMAHASDYISSTQANPFPAVQRGSSSSTFLPVQGGSEVPTAMGAPDHQQTMAQMMAAMTSALQM